MVVIRADILANFCIALQITDECILHWGLRINGQATTKRVQDGQILTAEFREGTKIKLTIVAALVGVLGEYSVYEDDYYMTAGKTILNSINSTAR